MRLLGAFLRLLVAGALGAPPAPAPEARGTASAEPPVLTFREIWNRSFCRPLEQLVDVITEFPNEVEYIFRPSCVSLQRCGGCCGDEGLRCVPVETSTVTMQLLKIKPNGEAPYVEMAFTEHRQCECSFKRGGAGTDPRPIQLCAISGVSLGGCRRGSGKKHVLFLPPPLPAIFHVGNFLSLLWFSDLG
ncbi:placenta growth factor isoform X1 [Buteo buteo]|uniref:placenta growth factor isoform X1 n=1 Tax=Buteo buteo TaxID=30397 RepID=UPI003EB8E334